MRYGIFAIIARFFEGVLVVPSALLGTIGGGVVIQRLNLSVVGRVISDRGVGREGRRQRVSADPLP